MSEIEFRGSRVKSFSHAHACLVPWFLCKALPPHGQILVCFSLIKSAGLTLMIPLDPTLSQRSAGPMQVAGGSWPWCIIGHLLNGFRPSTCFKFEYAAIW